MKLRLKAPAFTLIEVIIAITVFSVFIGFVVSAYLSFHRADQEALVTRTLMMEGGKVMDQLTADLKANKIDYFYYEGDSGPRDPGRGALPDAFEALLEGDHVLNEEVLALRSADELTRILYVWDSDEKTLTLQKFDMTDETNPLTMDGYTNPLALTSEQVYLNEVNFRIFPDVDPYDLENASNDEVAYQPVVTLNLTFAAAGRVREEVSLPLQTTVTSRFYQ